jgi:hypothetical protein
MPPRQTEILFFADTRRNGMLQRRELDQVHEPSAVRIGKLLPLPSPFRRVVLVILDRSGDIRDGQLRS